ncbi:MAG: hypothetical protein PHW65_00940 [Dehalococcoidales bacterium]|nr:hypothetical protein [Dehalococcoidales bacterium]
MEDKIVKIDDKEYVLRKFGIEEKINIRDGIIDAFGNLRMGTFQFRVLVASLKSWNYTDSNGNAVAPTEANVKRFLDPNHFDRLVNAAVELNEISMLEKKTLFNAPAGTLDGQSKPTTDKDSGQETK